MNVVMVILHIVTVLLVLLVLAIRPKRSGLSMFELDRLAKSGDNQAKADRRREQVVPDILSLQRALAAVLFVTASFLGVGAYGWPIGIIVAIVIALEAAAVAHFEFVRRAVNPLYDIIEPRLIQFITRHGWLLRPLRSMSPMSAAPAVHSKEELAYLIGEAGDVLGDDERAAITAGLAFSGRTVKDIMTPISMIDAIA
jgi:CBS domain containing-hemolysin-like protein